MTLMTYWMVVASFTLIKAVTSQCLVNHKQPTLREESSQANVILQYKLLEAILSVVCSVIQES